MAAQNFETILIIGPTSGIGEELAHRYHAQGKMVIATGRRVDRLDAMKKILPGLQTHQIDITDLRSIPEHIDALFRAHPGINTVFLNAGMGQMFNFRKSQSIDADAIVTEITTNFTAHVLLIKELVPRLLGNQSSTPCTLIVTSSALNLVPFPTTPVYCATKAALWNFTLSLRRQLKDTNVTVIELSPPYVDTALNSKYRDEASSHKPMTVDDYVDTVIEGLQETTVDGKIRETIGLGFSQNVADTWEKNFGGYFERFASMYNPDQ